MTDVICANCGHANQAGSNFCSSCGRELVVPVDEPTTMTFTIDGESGEMVELPRPRAGAGGVLLVTRGPNTGSEFEVGDGTTTVGRHPDSDIFLDDVTVSRRHVEIERTADRTVVRDVGSLNGTYLNRERIGDETELADGDELQVGRFKLVYVAGEGS